MFRAFWNCTYSIITTPSHWYLLSSTLGFPGGSDGRDCLQCRRPRFDPWVGRPTPAFLPGKFHGQRSLAGYSPWGCKESYMTEQLTLALLFHLQLGGLCVVNPQRKTKKLYRTSLFFFPPPRRNCFIFLESQLYVAIGMKGKKKNLTKQEYDFSFMYIGTFTCLVQNSFNSTNIYWIPTMWQP